VKKNALIEERECNTQVRGIHRGNQGFKKYRFKKTFIPAPAADVSINAIAPEAGYESIVDR
jgi:hypothetical protein